MVVSIAGRYSWEALLNFKKLGLNTEAVIIEGSSLVPDAKILDALDLKPGRNILKINIRELEGRLTAFSRIKSATVKRDFPDGLKIQIEEVEPAGYLFRGKERYVVTAEGDIFPGTEGPGIEFKVESPEKIRALSKILSVIYGLDKNFYKSIVTVECNYREEVIIYNQDYYLRLPAVSGIDETDMKRYIYLLEKVTARYRNKITYVDLRFVDFDNGKVEGALIVK